MSGKRDWLFRIQDMMDGIAFIKQSLAGVSKDEFLESLILQRGIERSFEIIGEAARFVPQDIQKKYSDIEWSNIIGMRHKISHDYMDVDSNILWDLYKNDFFGLHKQLENLLKEEDK